MHNVFRNSNIKGKNALTNKTSRPEGVGNSISFDNKVYMIHNHSRHQSAATTTMLCKDVQQRKFSASSLA